MGVSKDMPTRTQNSSSKKGGMFMTFGLVAASVVYAFSHYTPTAQALAGAGTAPAAAAVSTTGTLYKDGTYTGNSYDALYGSVQVQAVVAGGKLTDVRFLKYPSDRQTSQNINNRAMSQLKSEAIAAQGSRVNTVSGATDTSDAFTQSLHSALVQAQA